MEVCRKYFYIKKKVEKNAENLILLPLFLLVQNMTDSQDEKTGLEGRYGDTSHKI
jgi:hypothetical protein